MIDYVIYDSLKYKNYRKFSTELICSIYMNSTICCYEIQLKAYRLGCQEFMSNSSVDQKLLFLVFQENK